MPYKIGRETPPLAPDLQWTLGMHAETTETPNFVEQLRHLPDDPEMPGRRLRLAVLLRAFDDVRQGGRYGWEARRWLLSDETTEGGLDARELMEEAGLDVAKVRRNLRDRSSYGLRAA